MAVFQVNIEGETKGHAFPDISSAYKWVTKNVMTAGDADFYREIGNTTPLDQILDVRVQEAVIRNSFEKVCFSGWNDKIDANSPFFIYH